jgi:hypothetical protein
VVGGSDLPTGGLMLTANAECVKLFETPPLNNLLSIAWCRVGPLGWLRPVDADLRW